MTGEGIALIITSIGVAVAGIITAWRTGKGVKAVQESQTEIKATIGAVETKVGEIDKAVNGKAPGEQSIAGQVDDLHKEIPVPEPPEVVNGAGIKPLVELLVADLVERKAREAVESAGA